MNDPTMDQFYRRGLILTALLVLVVVVVIWQLVSLQFEGSKAAEIDETPVAEGVSTFDITALKLRDVNNVPLSVSGVDVEVQIDCTVPTMDGPTMDGPSLASSW